MLKLARRQRLLNEFAVDLDGGVGWRITVEDEDVDDGLYRKEEGPSPLSICSSASGRDVLIEWRGIVFEER